MHFSLSTPFHPAITMRRLERCEQASRVVWRCRWGRSGRGCGIPVRGRPARWPTRRTKWSERASDCAARCSLRSGRLNGGVGTGDGSWGRRDCSATDNRFSDGTVILFHINKKVTAALWICCPAGGFFNRICASELCGSHFEIAVRTYENWEHQDLQCIL